MLEEFCCKSNNHYIHHSVQMSMDSKATLFITGSTGQLGSFILAELLGFLAGEAHTGPILCAKRASSSMHQIGMTQDFLNLDSEQFSSLENLHWIDCDLGDGHFCFDAITDYCSVHGIAPPQEIIHAAASINISPSTSANTSNEQLTDQMLLLGELLNIKHFTHISSIAVMGGTVPLGEEEIIGPAHFHPNRSDAFLSNYALGKIASELQVWRAQANGMSISIIRPGVILGIGPKEKPPQELWARLQDGRLPLATDGSTGIVDVRDVASITVAAHRKRVVGPVIAVAENAIFHTLLDQLGKAIGATKKLKRLNAEPWLDRMRDFAFLSKVPFIGKFFTPQMRIMLFSKIQYDGTSGAELHRYRATEDSISQFGGYLRKVWI
jgi:nucleoside-diphosphate-sugar epimerase